MINKVRIQPYFFASLFFLVAILLFLIFKPFLSPLLLAGALAIIFHPVFRFWLKHTGNYPSLAALITLIVIILLVIIPLTIIAGQIFIEAKDFYARLMIIDGAANSIHHLVDTIDETIKNISPILSFDLAKTQQEVLSWLTSNFNLIFLGVFRSLVNTFIFFIALFYFLRDGENLKQKLIALSPLDDKDDRQIFDKIRKTVNSVIIGSLLIAALQGALTAIGFFLFNVGQPILWSSVGAVLSLIPGLGALLIFAPVVAVKIATGQTALAIGLALWGIIIVSPIDNILKPIWINRGIAVHPFLILMSVLGGLILFGPIGFLLGPIILSLFFALISIYSDLTKSLNQS